MNDAKICDMAGAYMVRTKDAVAMKTLEERARAWVHQYPNHIQLFPCPFDRHNSICDYMKDAYLAGAKEAYSVQEETDYAVGYCAGEKTTREAVAREIDEMLQTNLPESEGLLTIGWVKAIIAAAKTMKEGGK